MNKNNIDRVYDKTYHKNQREVINELINDLLLKIIVRLKVASVKGANIDNENILITNTYYYKVFI